MQVAREVSPQGDTSLVLGRFHIDPIERACYSIAIPNEPFEIEAKRHF